MELVGKLELVHKVELTGVIELVLVEDDSSLSTDVFSASSL